MREIQGATTAQKPIFLPSENSVKKSGLFSDIFDESLLEESVSKKIQTEARSRKNATFSLMQETIGSSSHLLPANAIEEEAKSSQATFERSLATYNASHHKTLASLSDLKNRASSLPSPTSPSTSSPRLKEELANIRKKQQHLFEHCVASEKSVMDEESVEDCFYDIRDLARKASNIHDEQGSRRALDTVGRKDLSENIPKRDLDTLQTLNSSDLDYAGQSLLLKTLVECSKDNVWKSKPAQASCKRELKRDSHLIEDYYAKAKGGKAPFPKEPTYCEALEYTLDVFNASQDECPAGKLREKNPPQSKKCIEQFSKIFEQTQKFSGPCVLPENPYPID